MTSDLPTILVVEDSDEDFDVLTLASDSSRILNTVVRAVDGLQALATLNQLRETEAPLPGLIILDLNLLGIDGKEVIRRLKADRLFARIPIIVLSTSSSPRDVESCYTLGASAYAIKPVSLERLEHFVSSLKAFWLDHAVLPSEARAGQYRKLVGN